MSQRAAALYQEGLALREAGQLANAFKAFAAAASDPAGPVEAAMEAGRMLIGANRVNEGLSWIALAARRAPQDAEPHYVLGVGLMRLGREQEALQGFATALALDPGHIESLKALAMFHTQRARFGEALPLVERWQTEAPGDPDPARLASQILGEEGRYEEALDKAQRAVELHSDARTRLQLAIVYGMLDRADEAVAEFRLACELDPGFTPARLDHASFLVSLGRFDAARAELDCVLAADPANSMALLALARIHRFTAGDDLIGSLHDQVAAPSRSPQDEINLHLALGKAYDDLGEAAAAIEQFHAANAVHRRYSTYSEEATLREVREMAQIFSREAMHSLAGAGARSERPVFILGMPRSGSTLVEQILTSHPAVAPAGEVNYFLQAINAAFSGLDGRDAARYFAELTPADLAKIGEEYLARTDRIAKDHVRVVDKLPGNFLFAGLIHLALPQAKIIHTVRDPLDTCLSIYSRGFGRTVPYGCDLTWLGHFHCEQAALMEHWRAVVPETAMIDVRYEDVVDDLETQARRLIAHCGLAWDERCLRFHESERAVHTASVMQVRRPIYSGAVGRHAPYAPYLGPLIDALNEPAG